jgi:hypothetical protein
MREDSPEMRRRRTSEENLGFGRVDIPVDPPCPCLKRFVKCSGDIQTRMDQVSFLIVVHSVEKIERNFLHILWSILEKKILRFAVRPKFS